MTENIKKILIVEDDNDINQMLAQLLHHNGYATLSVYSGTEALLQLEHEEMDLVLLDLMLPGKNGEEVLSELRLKSNLPVIVLTAIDESEKIVELLQKGANDYVTKPFDNEVLLARIAVQLRTKPTQEVRILQFKDLKLDLNRYDGYVGDSIIGLSKREFEILKLMMSNPEKVFTKAILYEVVWKDVYLGDDNTINVHISKLRAKLDHLHPGEDYIETIWGVGFKMSET
ncbi:MAG: response regulator transcription factor [Erysipelotrichaceae bacterium]|jgi:DNA-binding response OmpR family regulator|nr:response regulator transcription factor [Erysipelotrichaceae bacterium]